MQHGFSESEWLALLDGNRLERSRERLLRHIASCKECATFLERTRQWERGMAVDVQGISEALGLPEERLDELLIATLKRVGETRNSERPRGETARLAEATVLLRHLLEPLLGRLTTSKVIDLAALQSSPSVVPEIQVNTWLVFIQQLRSTVGSLCGLHTERLVDRIGRAIALEIL